ncbi:MAG: FAD binding domain-containing protein, partial [Thermoanaerobaculia bacterium]
YKKLKEKETFDWPLVEVCVNLSFSSGVIREARVVLGSVAPTPRRAKEAEAALVGARAGAEVASKAAHAAVSRAAPLSQNAYKVRLTRVLLERALKEAMG